jgi:DNA-directed RNA polymerase subunit A'
MINYLKEMKYQLLPPEIIRKIAVVEVVKPETYDQYGYPVDGGLMDRRMGVIEPGSKCLTCNKTVKECPGHFGKIELVRPCIHPLYADVLFKLINVTCSECGELLIDDKTVKKLKEKYENPIEVLNRLHSLVKLQKELKECPHCGKELIKVTFEKPYFFYRIIEKGKKKEKILMNPIQVREMVRVIKNETLEKIGFDPEVFRPEWAVLSVILVPPVSCRSTIILESGLKAEDDLTHKLADIIRANNKLKENIITGCPQTFIEDAWMLLQYHVATYFDNNLANIPTAMHRANRPLKGIVQRLKGKEGRFRQNLLGKRANYTLRSTVTPDIFIGIEEVGVPRLCSTPNTIKEKILTVREKVFEKNLEYVKKLIKEDKIVNVYDLKGKRRVVNETSKEFILEAIEPGWEYDRLLEDGDICLFNRQPSLHAVSMMGHKIRLMDGKSIRINPSATTPYNADFDGDEMNIHIPQTYEARVEVTELMNVPRNIIIAKHGQPWMGGIEDTVSGMFLLTKKTTKIPKKLAEYLLYQCGIVVNIDKSEISGKELVSHLIPEEITLETKTRLCKNLVSIGLCDGKCKKEKCPYDAYLKIEKGKIICGVLDKATVEGGPLIDAIYRLCGPEKCADFINKMTLIANLYISFRGMSASFHDILISEKWIKEREKFVKELSKKVDEWIDKYKKKQLQALPGKSLEESLETYIQRTIESSVKELESKWIRELSEEYMSLEKDIPSILEYIFSGARGNVMNYRMMSLIYGQAYVWEKRPSRGYGIITESRVISHYKPGDISLLAKGFIKRCYSEGLDMLEFFFMAMPSRTSEINKGLTTAETGYAERRSIYALYDLVVENDYTVRETTSGKIVQYLFGGDGLDPMKLPEGKKDIEKMKELVEKTR